MGAGRKYENAVSNCLLYHCA